MVAHRPRTYPPDFLVEPQQFLNGRTPRSCNAVEDGIARRVEQWLGLANDRGG
jgi:hypothetical protein